MKNERNGNRNKEKKVIKVSINFGILEQVDYNTKSKKVIPTNQWKRQNYIHNRSIVMTRQWLEYIQGWVELMFQ